MKGFEYKEVEDEHGDLLWEVCTLDGKEISVKRLVRAAEMMRKELLKDKPRKTNVFFDKDFKDW